MIRSRVRYDEDVGNHDQRAIRCARDSADRLADFVWILDRAGHELDFKRGRRRLGCVEVIAIGRHVRIGEKSGPLGAGRHLLQHREPLARDARLEGRQPGDVASRPGQCGDQAGADRISNADKDDRNRAGFPLQRKRHVDCVRDDDVRPQREKFFGAFAARWRQPGHSDSRSGCCGLPPSRAVPAPDAARRSAPGCSRHSPRGPQARPAGARDPAVAPAVCRKWSEVQQRRREAQGTRAASSPPLAPRQSFLLNASWMKSSSIR